LSKGEEPHNGPAVDRTDLAIIMPLSEGNPGALSILMRIITEYQDLVFPCFAYDLQNRGLIGSKIWYHYKDVHKEDFDAFVKDVWTGAPIDDLKRAKQ
jgi:hypothetical protein